MKNEIEILDIIDPETEVSNELILSQRLHDFVQVCKEYKVQNKEDATALMGKIKAVTDGAKALKEKVTEYLDKRCPNCDNSIYEGVEIKQVVKHQYIYNDSKVAEIEREMEMLKIRLDAAKKIADAEAEAIEAQISMEITKPKPDTKVVSFLKDSLAQIREKVVQSKYWLTKF